MLTWFWPARPQSDENGCIRPPSRPEPLLLVPAARFGYVSFLLRLQETFRNPKPLTNSAFNREKLLAEPDSCDNCPGREGGEGGMGVDRREEETLRHSKMEMGCLWS